MINNKEKINIKLFLKNLYFDLYQNKYIKEISLDYNDLQKYIPDLKKIFLTENIDYGNIFDNYRKTLISIFIDGITGYLSSNGNSIKLNMKYYYIDKLRKNLEEYEELIKKCSLIIIRDLELYNYDDFEYFFDINNHKYTKKLK